MYFSYHQYTLLMNQKLAAQIQSNIFCLSQTAQSSMLIRNIIDPRFKNIPFADIHYTHSELEQ